MGFYGLRVECVVLPVLLAAVCVVFLCFRLRLYFFSVSLFLVLCALVLVKFYLDTLRLCL